MGKSVMTTDGGGIEGRGRGGGGCGGWGEGVRCGILEYSKVCCDSQWTSQILGCTKR